MAHTVRDKKKLIDRVRRLRGQIDGVERALEREADCSDLMHVLVACRGAMNALISEVVEGHIRFHVVNPDRKPTSGQARATQELIDVLKRYLK